MIVVDHEHGQVSPIIGLRQRYRCAPLGVDHGAAIERVAVHPDHRLIGEQRRLAHEGVGVDLAFCTSLKISEGDICFRADI